MRSLALVILFACACGPPVPSGPQPISSKRVDGAPCEITIEQWALGDATHVPIGTDITWPSNPPASGSHFPRWAAFQEFTSAVPRGYYVHSLEHGAVVLLHNCNGVDATTCEAIKSSLRAASAAIDADPKCTDVRVRTVITPDPLIVQPLVAVTWGFIYRAACVDQPSLEAFVREHYAKGPEDLCASGVTSF